MDRADKRKIYITAFVIGCLPFLVSAVSFVARNDWIFYLYGDFNNQQIPFTVYLSENISDLYFPRFDFNAGAGLDYLNAYSFYNLFSPFTLIYALLPREAVIYAFTFVTALKFGCCSLAACIYISRFCKTSEYALIGAVLYTYSGYQMVNLVFHYMDALAFFPLLLAALEAAVTEKRRGIFGAAVFLCAVTNYYLFGIEVIFIVLYFFVRLTDRSFRIGLKDFFCLAAESVLGVMAAGIVIIPSAVYIINSPRLGEPFHSLTEMLVYETPWRYLRILQSVFMMPDLQGYTNFFPDYHGLYPHGSRWSSQGMYIPLFGVSGFIAYMSANKKSWQTKLTALCLIFAFVPVLNGIFSLGSSVYYARWMFAPVLIMSAMTACALENEPKHFKAGLAVNGAAVLLIMIFTIIFPMDKLSMWEENAYYSNVQKWAQLVMTLMGLIIAFLLVMVVKRDDSYKKCILAASVLFAFAVSEVTILFDMGDAPYPEMIPAGITGSFPDIEQTDYGSRTITDDTMTNKNLLWKTGTSYTFNSTVSPYVYEYCLALDISTGDIPENYPTQCLMSVKELIVYNPLRGQGMDISNIPVSMGLTDMFRLSEEKGMYAYYENTNFIPMGFCYDYCISKEDFLSLDAEVRGRLMLKAMVVEDVSAVSEFLSPIPEEEIYVLDDEEFSEECAKRAETYAYSCTTDDRSYTAKIALDEPELVFFSTAYDEGFTAYVDGEKTDIINANFGFQAIPVPAGEHTIRVEYYSPWRDIGIASSAIGIAGLAVYWTVCFILRRKRSD